MTERKATRQPARFRAFFSGRGGEGEGTVKDLCKQGCRVESDSVLPVGTEVELYLFSPDFDWPLKVERAVIRWTAALSFGLEFLSLGGAQRERLRQLLVAGKLEQAE